MIYILLFYEFFKTGLFSIGGGLATLPFLYDIAARYHWYTTKELANMIAISESTPGPLGVNMATYAGFHTAGIAGAMIATAGLVLPSIIVIVLIAKFLKKFQDKPLVQKAFYGLRPAVAALIAAACLSVLGLSVLNLNAFLKANSFLALFNLKPFLLFTFILILSNIHPIRKWHPAIFILIGAIAGIVFQL